MIDRKLKVFMQCPLNLPVFGMPVITLHTRRGSVDKNQRDRASQTELAGLGRFAMNAGRREMQLIESHCQKAVMGHDQQSLHTRIALRTVAGDKPCSSLFLLLIIDARQSESETVCQTP